MTLHIVAYMPNNPHFAIGGGTLTHINHFQVVQHTMYHSIKIIDALGSQYEYTKTDFKI